MVLPIWPHAQIRGSGQRLPATGDLFMRLSRHDPTTVYSVGSPGEAGASRNAGASALEDGKYKKFTRDDVRAGSSTFCLPHREDSAGDAMERTGS